MDEFNALLAELYATLTPAGKTRWDGTKVAPGASLGPLLENDPRLPRFDHETARGGGGRKTYLSPASKNLVPLNPNASNYGLPPQTPGDHLSAIAEGLWQGGRRLSGAVEDDGAFAPGSAGDLAARVAPFLHPATALPMLGYQGGRAAGATAIALDDPSAENIASAGIETAFVPFAAAPAARGAAGRVLDMLGSRKAALTGAGIGGVGIGTAVGMTAADAAEKKKVADAVAGPEATDPVLQSLSKQIGDLERQTRNTRNKDRIASYSVQLNELRTKYTERLGELTKADLPFERAYPALAQSWPFIQALGPLALGAVMKGKSSVGTYAANRPWRNALRTGEEAVRNLDPRAATTAADSVRAYLGRHQSAGGRVGRTAEHMAPLVGGASLGAELQALPAQYDAVMAPAGSPEQEAGIAKARNPFTYVVGGGIGALSAGTGAHLMPGARAPVGRSRALLSQVGTTPGETASKMAAGLDAQGVVNAARTGLRSQELSNDALLRMLEQDLRASLRTRGGGVPKPPGPVGGPRPQPGGSQLPPGHPNPNAATRSPASQPAPPVTGGGKGNRIQGRASAYSGDVRRGAQKIWTRELDSVNPAAQSTYAPDVQALATRMAAELASQGHKIPVETLAKRIAGSKKAMDLIRKAGGDPFSAAGRKLMTGGRTTLGLMLGILAAEEAARALPPRNALARQETRDRLK